MAFPRRYSDAARSGRVAPPAIGYQDRDALHLPVRGIENKPSHDSRPETLLKQRIKRVGSRTTSSSTQAAARRVSRRGSHGRSCRPSTTSPANLSPIDDIVLQVMSAMGDARPCFLSANADTARGHVGDGRHQPRGTMRDPHSARVAAVTGE